MARASSAYSRLIHGRRVPRPRILRRAWNETLTEVLRLIFSVNFMRFALIL